MTFPESAAALDDGAVAKLLQVQRLRDRALAGHGRRTAEVAVAIGGAMHADIETLDLLYLAGQLHDIGKLAVTESTLWKPAGLNHTEWREIRTHPEEGHRLVADVVHRDVAAAVLYHHERIDRNGYPYGIDAGTTPLVARIVSVADAFDVMTAGRPYQTAVPIRAAVEEIERCSGTQFDPDVAAGLRKVMVTRGDPRLTPAAPIAGRLEAVPEEIPAPVPAAAAPRAVPAPERAPGGGTVVELSDRAYGPPDPSPADPFERSPSMIRLRRSG
ncbi:MAG: HD domain-containing protein [Actinobacteria bacterium]|nr:HD domain-containing protein [Actinomycetota bacterium]